MTTLAERPPAAPPPAAPVPPTPRVIGRPLRPRDLKWSDVGLIGACALSSLALVWVVFYQLTLLSGIFGFLVCWFVAFIAFVWLTTSHLVDRQAATDRVVTVIMYSGATLVFGVVAFILGWVIVKGVRYFHFNLLYESQKNFQPAETDALRHIGVYHQIIGTLEQVGLAALIGVPVAVATAVFLNEVRGPGTRLVRTVITAMSALPSVVAGVFIFSIFVEPKLLNYCGFLAALALFILILPSVTRTTEEVLRIVPGGLREASLALGASEFRTTWSVVLPTARSGIITASLLGTAIAVGETAPLLFTAFGSQALNYDPFHGAQGALPLGIYINIRQPQAVLLDLAFVTAFILLVLVFVLFFAARILGRTRSNTGRSARRRSRRLAKATPAPARVRRGDPLAVLAGAAPTGASADRSARPPHDQPTGRIPPVGTPTGQLPPIEPPTQQVPPVEPPSPKERPDS